MMTLLVQPKVEWEDTPPFDPDEKIREARGGMVVAAWSLLVLLGMLFVPAILAIVTRNARWFALPLGCIAAVSAICAVMASALSERLSALFTALLIGALALTVGGII